MQGKNWQAKPQKRGINQSSRQGDLTFFAASKRLECRKTLLITKQTPSTAPLSLCDLNQVKLPKQPRNPRERRTGMTNLETGIFKQKTSGEVIAPPNCAARSAARPSFGERRRDLARSRTHEARIPGTNQHEKEKTVDCNGNQPSKSPEKPTRSTESQKAAQQSINEGKSEETSRHLPELLPTVASFGEKKQQQQQQEETEMFRVSVLAFES